MTFQNIDDFCTKLETNTGCDVYLLDRQDSITGDHIVVSYEDFITFKADNGTHLIDVTLNIIFLTKGKADTQKITRQVLTNYDSSYVDTSYNDDDKWWETEYLIYNIRLKEM